MEERIIRIVNLAGLSRMSNGQARTLSAANGCKGTSTNGTNNNVKGWGNPAARAKMDRLGSLDIIIVS